MVVAVVAAEHRTRPAVADCSNLVVTFFYSLFGCLTFVVAYLGIQMSPLFEFVNTRNETGIKLDMSKPEGIDFCLSIYHPVLQTKLWLSSCSLGEDCIGLVSIGCNGKAGCHCWFVHRDASRFHSSRCFLLRGDHPDSFIDVRSWHFVY